jgi:phage terminase large subunit GpA-like protein
VAVDSGGHYTHEVYLFCRDRRLRHIFAVKGMSQAARPILGKPTEVEVNYRGKRIRHGAQLWPVGADTAKALIYGRLRVRVPGPGYMHFSDELEDDYFEQLTAERLVTRYVKGRARLEWVKPAGRRNEALDLEVYALAAAQYVGIGRMRESDWQRLERKYQPAKDTPAPDAPVSAQAPAPSSPPQQAAKPASPSRRPMPRRPGFVNRWR